MKQDLCQHKQKFVFLCAGVLSESSAEDFAKGFIEIAGMTPARSGRIDRYPYRGGGGIGYTAFFPLMESYLIIDVYDDLNETEILLSTCKPERINLYALQTNLRCRIGLVKTTATL